MAVVNNNSIVVRSDETDAFINKQNRNNLNPELGVSLTKPTDYADYGALGGYMKDATSIMDKLYGECG